MLFTWIKWSGQWPYMVDHPEGRLTGASVIDEPSRLFLASVLQRDNVWGASLLLDGVHSATHTFSTCEDAQKYAENALTESLRVCGLLEDYADPLYEVAALLTVILDGKMQIDHISEYKREWVAVCISPDSTSLEDYVFARDSDGHMGPRLRIERLEVRFLTGKKKGASEQANRQIKKQLQFVREEKERLEQELQRIGLACEITRRDLQRTINRRSRCGETGSEQAERFERGIASAISRLEEVRNLHAGLWPMDWREPIWREERGK